MARPPIPPTTPPTIPHVEPEEDPPPLSPGIVLFPPAVVELVALLLVAEEVELPELVRGSAVWLELLDPAGMGEDT